MLAVLLAGICGISAFPQNEFHYNNNLQTDKCNVCYDLLCYTMDKARCTYYSLASDITGNKIQEYESPNEIIDEVDDMMFEYTERASNVPVYKDCVPFISQYTNCNRDNICSGCKTCNCDSEGLWNCSSTQHCRPDHDISLNHHTLVIVMEKLNEYKNTITRSKRSVSKDMEVISPQEVLKWMYGEQKLDIDKDFPNTTKELDSNLTNIDNAIENGNSILLSYPNQNEKQNLNDSESEPIVFEDLLNNLNVNDDKGHSSLEDQTPRSKNILYELEPTAINEITSSLLTDTTILDDDLQTNKSDTDKIIDGVFAFIDSDINENFNFKRDITHNRRLDKRDVGLQSFNVTSDNNTDKVNDLQNILLPLHNIVLQRQEELNKLIDIRGKLMTYIKPISDINLNTSLTNISSENITNLYFIQLSSNQNFEDLRKRNQDSPNKYLQKLKRDIYEVVRDIAGIQRFSNFSAMPNDLKILIRAMRNYVKKENERKKISTANKKNNTDFRKKIDTDIGFKTNIRPIDEIINILELLDNDMPTFNILNLLTPDTRKIITRIMNTYYQNNITAMDSQINKTYNFTRNLEGIGKNWNQMTIDIATNSLSERLYSMRLLHVVLSVDIEKIQDALAVLQFAEYRRMNLIDDITGETIIERIANDLRKSDRRFTHVIQIQTLRPINNTNTGQGNKLSKKKSFLQHIKTLLKNSKTDIRKLLQRKVPKSQIVKHIAKKKIEELRKNKLAEYEQTMQRWQRHRRSYKNKENKTEKIKKRFHKRGSKKTKNISTTVKTTVTTHQNKNNTIV